MAGFCFDMSDMSHLILELLSGMIEKVDGVLFVFLKYPSLNKIWQMVLMQHYEYLQTNKKNEVFFFFYMSVS